MARAVAGVVASDYAHADVPFCQPEQEFSRVGPRCVGDTEESEQTQPAAAQRFQSRLLRDRQVGVRQPPIGDRDHVQALRGHLMDVCQQRLAGGVVLTLHTRRKDDLRSAFDR
jgi:hypothetical protein